MDALKEFIGFAGLTKDDFVSAATDILSTGDIIHDLNNTQGIARGEPISYKQKSEAVFKNPILAIGNVLLARLASWHYDYLESQNTTHLLLQDAIESIDCAGAKPTEFWMQSDLAAIDKAKELGVNILPDYSMADLRYKIHCAIQEAI